MLELSNRLRRTRAVFLFAAMVAMTPKVSSAIVK
jgi:hypothetical protein